MGQMSAATGGEADVILGEPFNRIIGEVGEPRLGFAFEASGQADFVLVNLPCDSRFLHSLGERLPGCLHAVVHVRG
jgi:hypothetical protein